MGLQCGIPTSQLVSDGGVEGEDIQLGLCRGGLPGRTLQVIRQPWHYRRRRLLQGLLGAPARGSSACAGTACLPRVRRRRERWVSAQGVTTPPLQLAATDFQGTCCNQGLFWTFISAVG